MLGCPKDRRGYPVPANVMWQGDEPLFTVNSQEWTRRALDDLLCPLCGQPLEKDDAWFAGGPVSAFHPNGAYFDLPGHGDCIRYALQVCPYMIAPRYTPKDNERIERLAKEGILGIDPTVLRSRPLVMIMVRADGWMLTEQDNFGMRKLKPFRSGDDYGYPEIEGWKEGVKITDKHELRRLIAESIHMSMQDEVLR